MEKNKIYSKRYAILLHKQIFSYSAVTSKVYMHVYTYFYISISR